MLEQSVLIAVVMALVAVFVVLRDVVKSHRRRKSRALHFRRMSTSQPAQLADKPYRTGMGPERLEHIRMEAENAARLAFRFPDQKIANPYPDRTRESVLWAASYHQLSIELCEEEGHFSGRAAQDQ